MTRDKWGDMLAFAALTLGALAIGGSFSWGDLGCYAAGIALGALLSKDKKRK